VSEQHTMTPLPTTDKSEWRKETLLVRILHP
jgi:hypothetical protein